MEDEEKEEEDEEKEEEDEKKDEEDEDIAKYSGDVDKEDDFEDDGDNVVEKDLEGWERSTRVSLRAASKESTPWSAFSKNRCKCTAGCSTQRRPCKKNKIECTSHCHKGDNCKNKNCKPASAMKLSTPSNSNKTPWILKLHYHVYVKGDATVLSTAAVRRTNRPALQCVTQDILALMEITINHCAILI